MFFTGLLLANLYAIINPTKIADPIIALSKAFNSSPISTYVYTKPAMLWDGGTYGNLYYWFGSGISFFALMAMSLRVNIRLGLMSLCSFILMLMFISTQPAHNWYWFPVIGIITIPFTHITNLDRKARITIIILTSMFLTINLIESHRWIKKEVFYLNIKESSASETSEINACLKKVSSGLEVDKLYDMASIGYSMPVRNLGDTANYHDSFVRITSHDFKMNKGEFYSFGKRAKGNPTIEIIINDAKNKNYLNSECGHVTWIYVNK